MTKERFDKFGNPLVSDEVFKLGYDKGKEYFDYSLKYDSFKTLKQSNVFLGYLIQAISDGVHDTEHNYLNDANINYDMTYQDFDEIIGCITGECVDTCAYERRDLVYGWTGGKYNGYKPNFLEKK